MAIEIKGNRVDCADLPQTRAATFNFQGQSVMNAESAGQTLLFGTLESPTLSPSPLLLDSQRMHNPATQ